MIIKQILKNSNLTLSINVSLNELNFALQNGNKYTKSLINMENKEFNEQPELLLLMISSVAGELRKENKKVELIEE